jgi:glycosyltransferase involved in cell wall biosynthesis
MKNRHSRVVWTRNGLISSPFFSIIIAAYNRAQLLKRAVASLLSQTEEDWEAIIVDDGSTDEIYSEILPYLKSCKKIKYLRKGHRGEAMSKNEGIWVSNGKYVSFLDSDDEYHPSHLESRKNILMQNPSLNFLYGGAKIIGNQFVPDRFNYARKINLNKCVIGGTFFIERSILISLNGFREMPVGTDADLFDRARDAGISMMQVDTKTYIYHHETEDSITNNLCVSVLLSKAQG